LRPGAGVVDPAAILLLLAALFYATANLIGRHMRETESTVTQNIFLHVGFLATSVIMGLTAGDGRFMGDPDGVLAFLFRPWVWPPLADWPVLITTGVAVAIAGLLVSQAYRIAEAGLIAPFEYLGMPMAIIAGIAVFGTWPDTTAWMGIVLICGAGLYVLWREMVHARVQDPAVPLGDI
jgi:drug/metabolite transporter (DMT)-like permease